LPIVAVVGTTAVGKSELALDLAEALGGEVVNTDSMQLYRGMDIGTAKLPLEERRGITHHLLDVLDVRQTATVAEFQAWSRGGPAPRSPGGWSARGRG
jgi:tRNA dimethylallyltransferase